MESFAHLAHSSVAPDPWLHPSPQLTKHTLTMLENTKMLVALLLGYL